MLLLENFIELFLDSAPWLLLGLVLAGVLNSFIPMSWMQKQLGGNNTKSIIKAALFGAPLPLCSCGVIPAAVGLRRAGASKSATTSFLVSTPETGIDSISVSYAMLGPFMAVVRPVAAISSAILAGLLVGRDKADDTQKPLNETPASSCCAPKVETTSCCAPKDKSIDKKQVIQETSCCTSNSDKSIDKKQVIQETSCCTSNSDKSIDKKQVIQETSCCTSNSDKIKTMNKETSDTCCSDDHSHESKSEESFYQKLFSGIKFSSTNLIKDISLWLMIGLFFAALIQTYLPSSFLENWGSGIFAMLIMVVISIPMYICATASTPIAAALLLSGISPGAVLVFMMAGPATNIATLGVVYKELGSRSLIGYLTGVLGGALFFGWLTDYLVQNFNFEVVPLVGIDHQLLPETITYLSAFILALLMLNELRKKIAFLSPRFAS